MCLAKHALPLRSSPARDEGATGAFCSCGIYRKRMTGESHRGFLCLPVVDSVEVAAEIYVAAAVGADEFMGG